MRWKFYKKHSELSGSKSGGQFMFLRSFGIVRVNTDGLRTLLVSQHDAMHFLSVTAIKSISNISNCLFRKQKNNNTGNCSYLWLQNKPYKSSSKKRPTKIWTLISCLFLVSSLHVFLSNVSDNDNSFLGLRTTIILWIIASGLLVTKLTII